MEINIKINKVYFLIFIYFFITICCNNNNMNSSKIVGPWKVINTSYKVPGWHTNIISSIIDFQRNGQLKVDTIKNIDIKMHYVIMNNLLIIEDNFNNRRKYEFKLFDDNSMVIEDSFIKIELIKVVI